MPPEIINGFLIFNNLILCNSSKSNPFSVPSLSTEVKIFHQPLYLYLLDPIYYLIFEFSLLNYKSIPVIIYFFASIDKTTEDDPI